MLDKAAEICQTADIFIVVGTSLNVYPAAGLVHYVPSEAKCFLVDPSEVSVSDKFTVINENASTGLLRFKNLITNKN
jgi:NAD-dependent deacetylase